MKWKCPECGNTEGASPRYATTPGDGENWSNRIAGVAAGWGLPLIPWQELPAKLIGELRDDSLPRFPTTIVSVPRQSGKTTIAKAATTAKAEMVEDQRLYGTAQTRVDAVSHLEELAITLGGSVKNRLGVGAERITWPNGSLYRVIAPNDTGGHGPAVDWMLIDEAWSLSRRLMGGVRPAMSARPHSQMLVTSTMGTVESEMWNGLVAMGREAVEDSAAKIAYVEFSAPDDAAVFDESKWHEWMPGLGRIIGHEHIRADMSILEPTDFIRGYGNRVTAAVVSIFPAEWVERAWRVIEPSPNIVLSVEVNDEPPGGTVASGHLTAEGGTAVRVLEWRYGSPQWIPALVSRITTERDVEAVVVDGGGPARAIMAELSQVCDTANVALIDRRPRDQGADTGRFYDALREEKVVLERSHELAAAITGAHRKDIGDLWVISRRRMNVDASPLIAAIMAFGVARELSVTPKVKAFVL